MLDSLTLKELMQLQSNIEQRIWDKEDARSDLVDTLHSCKLHNVYVKDILKGAKSRRRSGNCK